MEAFNTKDIKFSSFNYEEYKQRSTYKFKDKKVTIQTFPTNEYLSFDIDNTLQSDSRKRLRKVPSLLAISQIKLPLLLMYFCIFLKNKLLYFLTF